MLVKVLLPALAAIGSVSAQSGTCTVTTTTINNQADATALASCRTVKGSVLIAPGAGPDIDISGPAQITGDLNVTDNGALLSFKANDLSVIGGSFYMRNVTRLTTLNFPSLQKAKTLFWRTLNAIDNPTIALSQADEITISDTFLSSLAGINVQSASKIDINNNRRLADFTSQLGNLTGTLTIQANGLKLKVSMPKLIWIANMAISNVTSFSVPALTAVNGSARFDSNYFDTFSAPNLTKSDSDISFVGNPNLNNISFPVLTKIGGGLTVANNTGLAKLDGFPVLKEVDGAVLLRGNFTEVDFPALDVLKGAFTAVSTGDISNSCTTLQKLKSSGQIAGQFSCESNNANANSDTGSDSGSGGSGSGKKDAASGVTLNTVLLGLAALVGLAQAFL